MDRVNPNCQFTGGVTVLVQNVDALILKFVIKIIVWLSVLMSKGWNDSPKAFEKQLHLSLEEFTADALTSITSVKVSQTDVLFLFLVSSLV